LKRLTRNAPEAAKRLGRIRFKTEEVKLRDVNRLLSAVSIKDLSDEIFNYQHLACKTIKNP
jgi:hypothetical protein